MSFVSLFWDTVYVTVCLCLCLCACDAELMSRREDTLVLCVAWVRTSTLMKAIPFFQNMTWKSYLIRVLISMTFSWYLLLIST